MPEKQRICVLSLGWEDLLEEEMATHSVFLPDGQSHGQRTLVGYSPWGPKSVEHELAIKWQQQHL